MTPIETQLRTFATRRNVDKLPDYTFNKSKRVQIIEIMRHRISTLSHTEAFQGKAMMVSIAEKTKARFENLSKCTEERLNQVIQDETPSLLFLYSENTRFKIKRNQLLSIIYSAHYVE